MPGRKDAARAALARVPHLHPALVDPILAELDRESLLDRLTPSGGSVRAATPCRHCRRQMGPQSRAPTSTAGCGSNRDIGAACKEQHQRIAKLPGRSARRETPETTSGLPWPGAGHPTAGVPWQCEPVEPLGAPGAGWGGKRKGDKLTAA
jgi:hypothetical protein